MNRPALIQKSIGALVIALATSCSAFAGPDGPKITRAEKKQGDGVTAKIVNGTPTFAYPTAGALLYRNANTPFGSYCTATLIGCSTVLTAAHCVSKDTDIKNYKVFFQHGGLFDLTGTAAFQRSKFEFPTFTESYADVAVLKLAKAVEGIAPDPINDDREQAPGVQGTIVGYGVTGGANADYGLKRYGFVTAAACPAAVSKKDLLCWNFTDGRTSDTCNGDSGGPLFLSDRSRPHTVISGVTSGGNAQCQAPDHAFDASVFRNNAWIKSAAGADLGHAACGSLKPVPGDPNVDATERYQGFSGRLDDKFPTQVFEADIVGTRQLRVGVNLGKPIDVSSTSLVSQPKLYVIKGSSTAVGDAVCSSELTAQAAFCSVESPADGTYTVVLMRDTATNIADFQLVISVF